MIAHISWRCLMLGGPFNSSKTRTPSLKLVDFSTLTMFQNPRLPWMFWKPTGKKPIDFGDTYQHIHKPQNRSGTPTVQRYPHWMHCIPQRGGGCPRVPRLARCNVTAEGPGSASGACGSTVGPSSSAACALRKTAGRTAGSTDNSGDKTMRKIVTPPHFVFFKILKHTDGFWDLWFWREGHRGLLKPFDEDPFGARSFRCR